MVGPDARPVSTMLEAQTRGQISAHDIPAQQDVMQSIAFYPSSCTRSDLFMALHKTVQVRWRRVMANGCSKSSGCTSRAVKH